MQPLEDVLSRVYELRRDLSAMIEPEIRPRGRYYSREYDSPDASEVASDPKPDIKKRQEAMAELRKIYQQSEWYSARYEAGRTTGVSDDGDLSSQIDSYLSQLAEEVKAVTTGGRVDKVLRKKARTDLKYLYSNLLGKKERARAGNLLDYSRIRIWATELARPGIRGSYS